MGSRPTDSRMATLLEQLQHEAGIGHYLSPRKALYSGQISILRVVKIRLLFKRVLAEVAHCAKFEFSLLTHICTADAAG